MKLLVLMALVSLNNGIQGRIVNYTVYNAVEGQTDNTPITTADGSKIVKPLNVKWIAVSRDLLNVYNYGDTINVYDQNKTYTGKWVIHDCMNERFRNKIDFLVPDSVRLGKGKILIK